MFKSAIQTLIANRCRELELGQGELVRRCGYRNVLKGMRRLAQLCARDVHKGQTLLRLLPIALELSPDVVDRAVAETRQQVDDAKLVLRVRKRRCGAQPSGLMRSFSLSGRGQSRYLSQRSSV